VCGKSKATDDLTSDRERARERERAGESARGRKRAREKEREREREREKEGNRQQANTYFANAFGTSDSLVSREVWCVCGGPECNARSVRQYLETSGD
jgi:hypothetical protein